MNEVVYKIFDASNIGLHGAVISSGTTSHHIEERDVGLDRPLYLRNKLYDETLKSQNYYSNILRSSCQFLCLLRLS